MEIKAKSTDQYNPSATGSLRGILPVLVAGLVLLAVTLPYIVAFGAGGQGSTFIGFLHNPIDGNSYLAKMVQGWEGSWRYRLAFSPERGEGAYLFTFYLFLGHLGRLTGIPLIGVFHGARVLAVGFMLFSIYRFFKKSLPTRFADLGFILAVLGSGLGWLALPFGAFTADLWVAEGYPFLSAYANPHFPFSLGLMTWMLTPASEDGMREIPMVLLGSLLALSLPFGLFIVLGVLGVMLLNKYRQGRISGWVYQRIFWLSVGGGPILLYDFWLVQSDPIFAGWNAQNITVTPPPWDLLVSYSPAVLLALYAVWSSLRDGSSQSGVLITWVGVVLVLIYLPLDLQRRLLTGFYIPLAGLAVQGLDRLMKGARRKTAFIAGLLILFSLPTNLIVLLAARHGIQSQDPLLYMTSAEGAGFEWINENTHPEALILAGPETGMLIPGQTGRRVIYGHPFETIDAAVAEAKVLGFFGGIWEMNRADELLAAEGVSYVFYGPRERGIGALPLLHGLERVFQEGEVEIYAVSENVRANGS